MTGLRLPWRIGDGRNFGNQYRIHDARGGLVAHSFGEGAEFIAEAIVAAMNRQHEIREAIAQGERDKRAILDGRKAKASPVYTIVTVPDGLEVARGTSANEAWERAAGHDGAVRMVVR